MTVESIHLMRSFFRLILLTLTLPENWITSPLYRLTDIIQSGARPSGGVQKINEGIPSIGAQHLNWNGGIDLEKIKYIPEEFYRNLKRGIICKNDILMVKDGATIGKVSFIDDEFQLPDAAINNHVVIIRTNNVLDQKFLFYYLLSTKGQLQIHQSKKGLAQPGVSLRNLSDFFIDYPKNIQEQQNIVKQLDIIFNILKTAKVKIKNLKISTTQKLIFTRKSLFDYCILSIINYDEKDGYESKKFNDITQSFDKKRKPIKKSIRKNISGKYPYFGATGIIDHINDYIFDGDFLLITEDASLSNPINRNKPLAHIVKEKFWVNNHAHVIQPTSKINIEYLCHYMNGLPIMKYAKMQQTRAKLRHQDLSKINVVFPNLTTQQEKIKQLFILNNICQQMTKDIQKVISQQEKLIVDLNQLQRAVLNIAFLGGLTINVNELSKLNKL